MRIPSTSAPARLLGRFVLAGILIVGLTQLYGERFTSCLMPVFRTALGTLQDDFVILDMGIAHGRAGAVLRVRADFGHPVYVAGRVLYPMSSSPETAGWMQVEITVGGVLQYVLLSGVVLVAWPCRSIREYSVRLAIGVPLGAFLSGLAALSTILAELWFPVHADLAVDEVWPLLVWSRFLMGGGGVALVLGMAAAAIVLAATVTGPQEADISAPKRA